MVRSDVRDSIGAPWWGDRPVIIIGGGPSLRGFDFGRLLAVDAHVVGVNQAMFDAPCSAGVTADQEFVGHHWNALADLAERIEVIVAGVVGHVPGTVSVRRHIGGGLSTDPQILRSIGSSGYAAVNAAVLKRAKQIILLGFDYGHSAAAGDHYHDAYPWFRRHNAWGKWALGYESMVSPLQSQGIEIVNASPHSAISCFPRVSIDEALSAIGCPVVRAIA